MATLSAPWVVCEKYARGSQNPKFYVLCGFLVVKVQVSSLLEDLVVVAWVKLAALQKGVAKLDVTEVVEEIAYYCLRV
jgi:hypothetical protein